MSVFVGPAHFGTGEEGVAGSTLPHSNTSFTLGGPNVKLVSSDKEPFDVPLSIIMEQNLQNIRLIIEDTGMENPIPLPNVNSKTLAKVLEFAKVAAAGGATEDYVKMFFDELESQEMLFEIILASNYLNYKRLLDASCQRVADMIKGKTPEEIREKFNIVNDFSPTEEEEVKRENQWAFE